jgi:hypothetical protein
MTDGVVHDPRAASLALLDGLVRRGRALQKGSDPGSDPFLTNPRKGSDPGSDPFFADIRIWQRDCAAAINELSGGNKSHWLSRAYSSALLVRSTGGEAVVEADAGEIVRRVLDVLEQARQSLISMDTAAPYSADAQEPHRFDFVHDPDLRPVLEQAFVESRSALEKGSYEAALKTTCGILEAIITDALDARLKPVLSELVLRQAQDERVAGPRATAAQDGARGFSRASFEERIAAAEAAGLIRGGCARLPAAARAYRDADQSAAISEREATVTRQVLRVVMRDLDPGR